MKLVDKVPDKLIHVADRIPEEFGRDLAWKFPDVIHVVDWCQSSGVAILGGETYMYCQEPPHFEPTLLTWYVRRKEGEDWQSFVNRSGTEAKITLSHLSLESGTAGRFTLDMVDRIEYLLITSIW